MEPTILRNEGVIRSLKIDKPIPIAAISQKNGGTAKQRSNGRGAVEIHRISAPNNINILCSGEDCNRPNRGGKLHPLLRGCAAVEVEEVLVVGVVEGPEQPEEAGGVAVCTGDEVGELGGRWEGVGREVAVEG